MMLPKIIIMNVATKMKKSSIAIFLDIIIVTAFLFLILVDDEDCIFRTESLLPFFVGIILILCNRLKRFMYTMSFVNWFAIYVIRPSTKINHLIWGVFFIAIALLQIDKNQIVEQYHNTRKLFSSTEFWILVILVVMINIFAGWYYHKKKSSG